jgi:hypothetical protein
VGAKKHLIIDTEEADRTFQWSNDIPGSSWVVGSHTNTRSIEEVAKIFHMIVPSIFPEEQKTAFYEVDPEFEKYVIPWNWVLPEGKFHEALSNTLEAASEVVCTLEDSGYMKTYVQGREILQMLVPARTCAKRIGQHIEQNKSGPSTESALKSFIPNKESFSQAPVYSQTSSVTGRLTVEKGPSILTLPAKCRDLIRTRHSSGRVIQVDFVSLEPRVAKYLAGFAAPSDIYDDMCKILFNGTIDRKTAKLATLSALYGASSQRLDSFLGPGKNGKNIIRSVRQYFGLERIEAELKNKMISQGNIENALGRPLFPKTTSKHILVSHFIQSTAVDIALCGFSQLMKNFEMSGVTVDPLYIIHDAIVIDVEESQYSAVKAIVDDGITHDLGHFPVSISGISRS